MLTTLTALVVMNFTGHQAAEMVCPISGHPADKTHAQVDYNGIRYSFCCDDCPAAFAKNPAKVLAASKTGDKVVGVALFDPVGHKRINSDDAKASADYKGVRYYFAAASSKATFMAKPAIYTAPAKTAMLCPVTGEKVDKYADAAAIADYNGVRYYVCCPGCLGAIAKGGEKMGATVTKKYGKQAAAPVAQLIPVTN